MAQTTGPTTVDADGSWTYGTVVSLTNANGSTGSTIGAVGATFDATAQTAVNNNFRVLSDKINQIIAVLQSAGLLS
jgi:hypothetical protein